MVSKIYVALGFVALFAVGFFFFGFTEPPQDAVRASISGNVVAGETGFSGEAIEIMKEESHLEFEGFGPGKSHVGTFEEWSGNAFIEGDRVVGIEGIISSDSIEVNEGIERLKNHLKSDDFLGVEEFPEITFLGVVADDLMTGELSLHGVSKEISFPVEVGESSVSADFVLDSGEFGISHPAANEEVRVAFNFVF